MSSPHYAELQVTSHFSFLRGASSCEELFATAAVPGIEALAVVDRNSLAGIVRAHEAAKTTEVLLVVGCRLDLRDGMSVLVYPTDRATYSRLCRLLSLGKKRAGKGKCDLAWTDLATYGEGLIAAFVPDVADEDCALHLGWLRETFGDRAYMALSLRRRPNDQLRLHELSRRLRGGTAERLDIWLQDARKSGIYGLRRFSRAIRQDIEAVRNAVLEPWSNGQTEGQINKLKTLKRAMYGRAGIDLLRARMLPLGDEGLHRE